MEILKWQNAKHGNENLEWKQENSKWKHQS